MVFSICYWVNYTQGKTKLSRKSVNAVADDRVLEFLYDADLCHVESSVRCHRKSRSRINNVYLVTHPITNKLYNNVRTWLPSSFIDHISLSSMKKKY